MRPRDHATARPHVNTTTPQHNNTITQQHNNKQTVQSANQLAEPVNSQTTHPPANYPSRYARSTRCPSRVHSCAAGQGRLGTRVGFCAAPASLSRLARTRHSHHRIITYYIARTDRADGRRATRHWKAEKPRTVSLQGAPKALQDGQCRQPVH